MWITLDREQPVPLLRQVYAAFREAILTGKLPAGAKLPSTRELAGELQVSRNVVLEAYELLLAEGFLESRPGAGTYVAEGARLPGYPREYTPDRGRTAGMTEGHPPDQGRLMGAEQPGGAGITEISFRTGRPALDQSLMRQWATVMQQVCLEAETRELDYGDPAGDPALRAALAGYLGRSRGMDVDPGRIVITGGAVQALHLAGRLLLGEGGSVLVEEPTNGGLLDILSAAGPQVETVPVPVDDGGLRTDLLEGRAAQAGAPPKAVYVTPSHQFPLGGVLPVQRRIELIRFAERTGCYVLEDDYDSEFRMDGPPLHTLRSLAPDRVLYIGTFSKMLFPALRIGYAVLPEALAEPFVRLKRLTDYQSPGLEQRALARFLESGRLAAHIRRMHKLYRKRRAVLLESLEEHFGPQGFRVYGQAAGLHLAARIERPLPEGWAERLRAARVAAALEPEPAADGQPAGACRLLLGYGHLGESEIREGVRRLAQALLDGPAAGGP